MGDSLALLTGPMLNTLFVEQRNNALISNGVNEPRQPDIPQTFESILFETSTSWDDSGLSTLKNNSASPHAKSATSGDQRVHALNEYTVLTHYYMIPVMFMGIASVLSPQQKGDRFGIKEISNDFDETILFAGLVILELCRSVVANGAYGLMVTYLVKHLKMGKTAASRVTSS